MKVVKGCKQLFTICVEAEAEKSFLSWSDTFLYIFDSKTLKMQTCEWQSRERDSACMAAWKIYSQRGNRLLTVQLQREMQMISNGWKVEGICE